MILAGIAKQELIRCCMPRKLCLFVKFVFFCNYLILNHLNYPQAVPRQCCGNAAVQNFQTPTPGTGRMNKGGPNKNQSASNCHCNETLIISSID